MQSYVTLWNSMMGKEIWFSWYLSVAWVHQGDWRADIVIGECDAKWWNWSWRRAFDYGSAQTWTENCGSWNAKQSSVRIHHALSWCSNTDRILAISRKSLYESGGLISVTSRILVVDMLSMAILCDRSRTSLKSDCLGLQQRISPQIWSLAWSFCMLKGELQPPSVL